MPQLLSWQGDYHPSWRVSSMRPWHLAVESDTVPGWFSLESPLCAPTVPLSLTGSHSLGRPHSSCRCLGLQVPGG